MSPSLCANAMLLVLGLHDMLVSEKRDKLKDSKAALMALSLLCSKRLQAELELDHALLRQVWAALLGPAALVVGRDMEP